MRLFKSIALSLLVVFPLTATPVLAKNNQSGSKQSQSKVKTSYPKISFAKNSRPKVSRPKNSRPKVSRPKNSRPKVSRPKNSRPKMSRPKGSKPKHNVADTGATLGLALLGFGALALGARKLKK